MEIRNSLRRWFVVYTQSEKTKIEIDLHNKAAAFDSWALGCWLAADSAGWAIAASAARFWIFIDGSSPAAAAAAAAWAADSFWAFRPVKLQFIKPVK